MRFIISRREREGIHESTCGPGNSPPLLLTVKESACGPGNSPPLLLTGKGQLPSPIALYKSKFSVPHKTQLNQNSLPPNRSSGCVYILNPKFLPRWWQLIRVRMSSDVRQTWTQISVLHLELHYLCCCCLVTKSCLPLLWPHGLEPARLLYPWSFPGNTLSWVYLISPTMSFLKVEHLWIQSSFMVNCVWVPGLNVNSHYLRGRLYQDPLRSSISGL